MAQAAWLRLTTPAFSAKTEDRSDSFGSLTVDTTNLPPPTPSSSSSASQPRPIPPSPHRPAWELSDILSPSAAHHDHHGHARRMSGHIDYQNGHAQQGGAYAQHDIDHAFSSSIHGQVDHSSGQDDMPQDRNYDLFPGPSPQQGSGFASQRYRNASSSSSSLGPSYGMGSDSTMYSHPSFGDSAPSFSQGGNSHPYDMMNSLPSSYSSGKVSPLTPSDSVAPFQHSSAFPPAIAGKDFHQNGFPDDRRLPNVGGANYQSDFPDDFNMNAIPTGLGYPPSSMQRPYSNRYPDGHFSSMHHSHPPDVLRGVAPQATHGGFRQGGVPGYDDMPGFMGSPHDMPSHMSSVDEALKGMGLQGHPGMHGGANDLQTFMRPYLDQYVRTHNRLAFGERTVIVMSSKVAQKSYGTEKRFLCPPPTAIMIGNSWWTDVVRRGEDPKLCPPRVVISISGEPAPQEGSIEWTGASGKSFDVSDPPTGTTYLGRCVGKQLFISDVDEKKKKVEALVKITAPASDDEPERVIGTFPSRPIKVISKPSKKRQSAKNLEPSVCINHGSTISLFHRLRSQTVSTKYLCVSGSGSSFKGSDGAPLMGLDQRARTATPSFIARTASWDPFVMYIVDVNKPAGGVDAPPPPPPQPDYPSPPPNAISFTNNGSQIPIYYNQTVVLQCLTSGVVSPVLIIRKVDHQTTVVGGGLQEGAKGVADHYCAPGEVCGDPVSQLHKIAFEVFDGTRGLPEPGTPGATGAFLSCMGEKVNTYRPIDGRQWNTIPFGDTLQSPILPGSPTVSTPISAGANAPDYFGGSGSAPASPSPPTDFLSHDGGRVRKKRSTSSAGGVVKNGVPKGRKRQGSTGSSGGAGRGRGSGSDGAASSGALWQVDIGETSVWTIVGTDQVRYNFYVPPVLFDNQNAPQTGSFPIPSKPVTPFPGVVKYLPPDRAAEAPKSNCAASRAMLAKPNPHASKMLTVYGENFNKNDPVHVCFGSEPSPYVEVRCTEVLGCLPPDGGPAAVMGKRRPIILIRGDGVVFPSSVMYP